MNYDKERPSSTIGKPASGQVDLPENPVQTRTPKNWRLPVNLSLGVLVLMLLIGITTYFILLQRRPAPSGITTDVPPTPVNDKPPARFTPATEAQMPLLFPGLTIKRLQEGIVFKTEEDPGSGPARIQGTEVEANIRSLEDARLALELVGYYHNYFTAQGWDFYLSASGPTGDLEGWKRDRKYFIMEYSVDVHTGTRSAFLRYN